MQLLALNGGLPLSTIRQKPEPMPRDNLTVCMFAAFLPCLAGLHVCGVPSLPGRAALGLGLRDLGSLGSGVIQELCTIVIWELCSYAGLYKGYTLVGFRVYGALSRGLVMIRSCLVLNMGSALQIWALPQISLGRCHRTRGSPALSAIRPHSAMLPFLFDVPGRLFWCLLLFVPICLRLKSAHLSIRLLGGRVSLRPYFASL